MKSRIRCNIFSASSLVVALAVIPAANSSAIEPPPEEATPPAALLEEGNADRVEPGSFSKSVSLPYLGIVTAEVPEMLAEHLGLSGRAGVLVRTVAPDSPAEKAGLSINDILTNLGGEPIAGPESFSSSIRHRKVGEQVKIGRIHKGKSSDIEVTLAERPTGATARIQPEPYFQGMPRAHEERLRGLIEGNLGSFTPGDLGALPDGKFEDTFRQMRNRLNRAFGEDAAPGARGGIRFQQNSTIRLMDADGSIEINSSEGDTRVKVRDRKNDTVWSGPWNTEKDKAAAPDDVRERIDRVNAGGGKGFSFRFGKNRGAPDMIDN